MPAVSWHDCVRYFPFGYCRDIIVKKKFLLGLWLLTRNCTICSSLEYYTLSSPFKYIYRATCKITCISFLMLWNCESGWNWKSPIEITYFLLSIYSFEMLDCVSFYSWSIECTLGDFENTERNIKEAICRVDRTRYLLIRSYI